MRRGDPARLPHAKASRARPGDAGSDGSLVSRNCDRRGLFRPGSSSASFPLYARYYPSRVSVVATLETNDALDRICRDFAEEMAPAIVIPQLESSASTRSTPTRGTASLCVPNISSAWARCTEAEMVDGLEQVLGEAKAMLA